MAIHGNWDRKLSRRQALGAGGLGAAALVFGQGPFTSKALAAPTFKAYPYSLGVASGDPLPRGVVLWTRLAPDPLNGGGMPDAAVPVSWEVATDDRFKKVVAKGIETARPELGHSVHAEVNGLQPGAEYFYRFKAGKEISQTGRTKTAPTGSPRDLRFAFASCQHFENGYYDAWRAVSEDDLDVVFHLGDYIYEGDPSKAVGTDTNPRRHANLEPMDILGYRIRYGQYKGDNDLQAAHRNFPWVVTWDDHEVENNYAAAISQDEIDPAVFLQRRAAAYQAYYEHQPLRRSSIPRGPSLRLYRQFLWGDLAAFNVLDTRQFRSNQAAGDGIKAPNAEQADPRRTLTGAAQERWLIDNFERSRSRWNVLAQQVFFAQQDMKAGTERTFNMDAWDGYLGSRQRIQDAIQRTELSNPVVISGDVHASWANNLLANYDDPASEVIGTEFVGTSISSGGNGSDVRTETASILAENPHTKFFNNLRGYVRCTVDRDEWRTDYRVVPYVSRKGAPISTRATFLVADGQPGLQEITSASVPAGATRESTPTEERLLRQQDLAK